MATCATAPEGVLAGVLALADTNEKRWYIAVIIFLFRCAETQQLYEGQRIKRFVNIEAVAMRKLAMLNRAGRLDELRVPPGSRLEALKGRRASQHSVRVNDQSRVCFVWTPDGPKDVEIADYH